MASESALGKASQVAGLKALADAGLDEKEFVGILGKVIGESVHVQNNPPDLVPCEDKVIEHLLEKLGPYMTDNGGVLEVEKVTYVAGRSNFIVKYPSQLGETDKVLTFLGSHLDVVPANPEGWNFDPFTLSVDGDRLLGRGTTDCLGHVALTTQLLSQLARVKPKLNFDLWVVFIASEEAAAGGDGPKPGIESLMEDGRLEPLKNGPIIWIDCADSQPCIGTAGVATWHLTATGKLFHSGLPHKGINALELGMEASGIVQRRFYEDFPAHELEEKYNFQSCSTMKPTQIKVPKGGLNQLPPTCTVSGDIRLTPFYDLAKVRARVEEYVADMNADIAGTVPTRGPMSKYRLPEDAGGNVGKLEIKWGDTAMSGIACNLDSPGFAFLCEATKAIKGVAKPYSICGSLPLVGEMQEKGFDIQLTGYGTSATYHADNEFCRMSDMKDAYQILVKMMELMHLFVER